MSQNFITLSVSNSYRFDQFRRKESTGAHPLQERQAPDWLRRWVPEKVAEMVPNFSFRRVPAFCSGEGEKY
jgi:hypothetical protein